MTDDTGGAMLPEDYMSFLVRLWRDRSGDDQPGAWRVEIQQIQTGTCWHFSTHSELLAFLHQLTVAGSTATQPASEEPLAIPFK
jgi:hypothetical protein